MQAIIIVLGCKAVHIRSRPKYSEDIYQSRVALDRVKASVQEYRYS